MINKTYFEYERNVEYERKMLQITALAEEIERDFDNIEFELTEDYCLNVNIKDNKHTISKPVRANDLFRPRIVSALERFKKNRKLLSGKQFKRLAFSRKNLFDLMCFHVDKGMSNFDIIESVFSVTRTDYDILELINLEILPRYSNLKIIEAEINSLAFSQSVEMFGLVYSCKK